MSTSNLDHSRSLESAISLADWENAVDYVEMQLKSTSGSLRRVAQLAHKRHLKDFPIYRSEIYFSKYVEKQQFYVADSVFSTSEYVTPKYIAGKRRKVYLSAQMYILFCAHAIRIARTCNNLALYFKESNDKVSGYYGSEIIFDDQGKLNLDISKHVYRNYYIRYRKEINENIGKYDVAFRIDFQDFYDNLDIRILLEKLMYYVHHSDRLKHDFDELRLEKFANFFEYCMRGRRGLPQADNNYMANYLSDLYLKFWEIDIISFLNSISRAQVEDYKLIRYVDDTYLFIKLPPNTTKEVGNSRGLSILEHISDLTYYSYGLRINAKTQSYWLKDHLDVAKLRKKLKSTSAEGVFFRDPGEKNTSLANRAFETLKSIAHSVSIEEYISDDSEVQESLKSLYDDGVQKYLLKHHNAELESLLSTLNVDHIKVSPRVIFSLFKLFPRINNKLRSNLLKFRELTNQDEYLIENFVIVNYDEKWQSNPSFKKLVRNMRSPHLRDMIGVSTKKSSIYTIDMKTEDSLLSIGNFPNFIDQCRQRKLAEWDSRWSLALNHLLNEFQMVCHIAGQPQDN